jgi:hypothetical protein
MMVIPKRAAIALKRAHFGANRAAIVRLRRRFGSFRAQIAHYRGQTAKSETPS